MANSAAKLAIESHKCVIFATQIYQISSVTHGENKNRTE